MRIAPLAALLAMAAFCAGPAAGQFTFGAGVGTGVGSRGGDASATHATAFLQFKLPVVPGVRADAIAVKSPAGVGPFALAVSAVLSAPIPLVKPYLIAGWGSYGLGKNSAVGGWNAGVGVRASLGVGVFAEIRRHQRIARDLLTVGVTF